MSVRSEPLHNGRSVMRRPGLALAVALAALILVGAVVGWLIWEFQQLPPDVAAVLRVAVFTLPLVLVSAAGVVALRIAWRRYGWRESVHAHHVTALTRATVQRYPQALTSLSYSHHDSSKMLPAPVEETHAPPEIAPPQIPKFSELLDQGTIGPNMARMVLGYESGQPVEGDWDDLYSAGIGGLPGNGKTYAAAFLLAQSALMGGRLIVCDPNPGNKDSLSTLIAPLAPAMLCSVASDEAAILDAIRLATTHLNKRKAGQAGIWNICLAIDEYLALRMGSISEQLPQLVQVISSQGRKYGINAMLLAQRWDKAAAGEFRNTLASAYIFRCRRQEAAMLTGLNADILPGDTLALGKGEAYLLDSHGSARRVCVPHLTPHDMARVGGMLADINRPGKPPIGFRVPATAPLPITPSARAVEGATRRSDEGAPVQAPSTAAARTRSYTPEQARALALFRGGMGIHEVVKEVWQVHGGTKYQQRAAELNGLIRQALTEEG